MKYILSILAFSLLTSTINAQKNMSIKLREVGFHLGYSTYLGDLQPKDVTQSQPGFAIGASFRQYFSDRISAKVFANFARLTASDYKSGDFQLYNYRNLSFRTDVKEIGLQAEVSLFRYDKTNPYNDDKYNYHNFTPYIFGGFNAFYFNPKALYKDEWVELQPLTTEGVSYSKISYAIPFGLGFKYQANSKIAVGLELGVRKTFTDYLDDVSGFYTNGNTLMADKGQLAVDLSWRADEKFTNPKLKYPEEGTRRGDPTNKDWYTLAQFSISYNIGK
jgi:hypothetical protein